METKTGFDLNAALAAWRDEIIQQPAIGADAVRELEEHLRSTLDELRTHGLSEEEAFLVASRRLGRPRQLNPEFHRGHPETVWRRRVFWMVMGWLVMSLLAQCFEPLQKLALLWMTKASGEAYPRVILVSSVLLKVIIPVALAAILAQGGLERWLGQFRSIVGSRWKLSFALGALLSITTFGFGLLSGYVEWQFKGYEMNRFRMDVVAIGIILGLVKGGIVALVFAWLLLPSSKPAPQHS